jgi:hypothetical protein
VAVKPSSVPDGVQLRTAGGYVYATVNEIGALKASYRSATSTSPERAEGLFRGEVFAFTFGPLWQGGNVEPTLWIRDHAKEDIVLAEMPLPITTAPVWAHPVTLPTIPEGTLVRIAVDMDVTQTGLKPLFVFPSRFGAPWSARPFTVDALAQQLREMRGETRPGTPYTVFLSSLDTTKPTAYLVLLRP